MHKPSSCFTSNSGQSVITPTRSCPTIEFHPASQTSCAPCKPYRPTAFRRSYALPSAGRWPRHPTCSRTACVCVCVHTYFVVPDVDLVNGKYAFDHFFICLADVVRVCVCATVCRLCRRIFCVIHMQSIALWPFQQRRQ